MDYYESIPIGRQNAVSRLELSILWNVSDRWVRRIIKDLRASDNGDDFVIVSTSHQSGYYRSNERDDIILFKEEVSKRAKHTFIPLRKVNRILGVHEEQASFTNNLKMARMEAKLKGDDVIPYFKKIDPRFDKSLLSKIENGLCMPNPNQLVIMSKLYNKTIEELIGFSIVNI